LAIGLPLRNQAALGMLLSEIYSPASTNYHRYLTPEQFTERFGPTEQDYQTVIAFAKRNGLTVTATHANRVLLDVSGPVPDIERAFGVTLRTYRHPTENRTFHAPDVEPSVESGVPILDVSGLNDYALPHPQSLRVMPMANPTNAVPNAGSGPGGTYRGNDFRAAYLPGVTLDGTGQTVGLLEFDGYYPNDIATYTSASGLTNVPLQNVLLDGFRGAAGSDNIEVALDIEVAIAMAPALAKIVVFEAPNNTAYFNDILNAMAASNSIKQFGCSWSYSGTPNATMDQIFQQMSAQGQSFFDAAGDSDAYTGSTGVPNDDPNITIVGGTTLSTTGPGGSWVSETVWNSGGGVGSSGGISTYYSIPSWQTNIIMTTNQGSTTMRNIPDVALIADQVWVVHDNGVSSGYVSGTSIAAPLWAALVALANQLAASNGRPSVGFINPAIYAIGESANYTSDFHDINTGNNFWSSSPANFPAVPGFDLCTGWGTPAGQSLINNLVSPDTLGIVPGVGFAASGPAGGPFSPSSQNFFLTNSSASPLTWSLVNTSAWLNASATSGTLAVGETNSVTVSLTAAANSLAVGTYAAIVTFTNWDTHYVQNLP
ncbi:MAG TPA: protease pro-enzyme activation domain-containing protein, partial [Verrucomicrobiae bacterium]